MRTSTRLVSTALAVIAVALVGGCVSWQPGWIDASAVSPAVDASEPLTRAEALARDADTEAKLAAAIDAYSSVLERDPGSYAALSQLCQWNILRAAAYTTARRDKREIYRRALRYCDRALYTNAEFRALVDGGASLEEAASALTLREADAMLYWVTGMSYYFKEGLSGLGRLTGYRLIASTETLLDRLAEIDPDYGDGAVHFSRGIYYLGLPKFAGGDDAKSLEFLRRAEEAGPQSLLVPWGRAKYFYFETGDRAGFERDLRRVLAEDPHAASTPYAWNVYFQRDAAELLDNVDRLF